MLDGKDVHREEARREFNAVMCFYCISIRKAIPLEMSSGSCQSGVIMSKHNLCHCGPGKCLVVVVQYTQNMSQKHRPHNPHGKARQFRVVLLHKHICISGLQRCGCNEAERDQR